MGEGSEVHRSIKRAYIWVAGEPFALRPGDEVLGERLANLGGRDAARPGGEVAGRNRSGLYIRAFGNAARRHGLCAGCGGWCGGRGRRRGLGERGGGEQEGCADERDGPEVHGFTFERWLRRSRSTSLRDDGEIEQLAGGERHGMCDNVLDWRRIQRAELYARKSIAWYDSAGCFLFIICATDDCAC